MSDHNDLTLFDGEDSGNGGSDGGDGGAEGGGGDGEGPRPTRFGWSGETIDYSDAMLMRGRAYGSYVNTSRALPDVRDGLKPVQRRIIVAMDDLGIRSDRRYAKSARTVGHVIGIYHPHGDGAVYDAMVRMAQPWQSNLPLVDGQGNWGNLNNEAPAAAQRYTESRLSPAATEFLSDLRPEVVDYEPNFDESTQMPGVLPVTFPNLLVNGSMGVGWAMACSIPPHNLGEVVTATLAVLDDPRVSLDKLMKAMPGPDLPGGGIVVNPANLRAIYETGRGTVLVQGVVEQLPGQPVLRITQLPYQVSAKSIVEQTVQGAKDGKITEIFTAELPKNLTDANGVDVQIRCKRGGSLDKLASEILTHTNLRDTLSFNFTVLVDGIPRTLPLRDLLVHFVDFRRSVVTRRLQYERSVLARRVHLLLAERAAADVIDEVIRIIRAAADDADSKRQLMEKLRHLPHGSSEPQPIDEIQAQHIIDMALKKLNALNQLRLDEELAAKGARIDAIDAILESTDGVRQIVRTELREVRRRFGQPRRTLLLHRPSTGPGSSTRPGSSTGPGGSTVSGRSGSGAGTGGEIAAAPSSNAWVYVASDGAAMAVPRSGRAPSSTAPLKLSPSTRLVAMLASASNEPLLVITTQGRAYRTSPPDLQTGTPTARPLIELDAGDAVVAAFGGPLADYYLLVTEKGQVKRLPARTLESAHPGGMICCRIGEGDRLRVVVAHGADDDIVVAKAGGYVLRMSTGEKLRPVATATAGTVAGVRVDDGDSVVSAAVARGDDLVSIHRTGMALVTALTDYPVRGRNTTGVCSVLPHRPVSSPAGDLALVACGPPPLRIGEGMIFTDRGRIFMLPESLRPAGRRGAVSNPCLHLQVNERPMGVVWLERT